MPSLSSHKIELIHTKEEVLVNGEKREGVDVHQARCTVCPWQGPRRTAQWEAEDDATHHKYYPQEGQ